MLGAPRTSSGVFIASGLGYISFEATGEIRISKGLEDMSLLGVAENMTVQLLRHHHGYMEDHRDVKFKP